MGPVQYPQDVQNTDLGVMDTTPITQHPNEMNVSFVSSIPLNGLSTPSVSSSLVQDSSPDFSTMSDPCVLLPTSLHMSDLTSSTTFLNSMEIAPSSPQVQLGTPDFLSDLPTDPFTMVSPIDNIMNIELTSDTHSLSVSPPAQIPSPPVLNTPSSYSVGSLEAALDQPGVSVQRSRANTLVSSAAVSPAYMAVSSVAVGLPFLAPEVVISKQDEVSPKAEAESVVAVENMLEDIEQTAKHARAILHQRHDMATGSSIGILNERISQVTQKFAGLVSISSALASSYNAPLQSPGILSQEPKESMLTFVPTPVPPITSPMDIPLTDHLSVLDHSRKRCASELEEPRSVKAPKREPQDDTPLNMSFSEILPAATTPPFSVAGMPHAVAPVKSQVVPSRPQTPPPTTFSDHGPFGSAKSGAATGTSFSQYPSAAVDFSSTVTTPIPTVSPAFPVLHTSWSDSAVHTRHHHSLSVGSGLSLTPPIGTSNMVDPFTTPLQAVGNTSVSPPVGRMSRSGSINGAFPTSFGFGFLDAPGGGWSSGLGNGRSTAPAAVPVTSKAGRFPIEEMSPASSSASDRAPLSTHDSDDDSDDDDDEEPDGSTPKNNLHHSSDSPAGPSASDVPHEYRAEVDRIFFEYLNKICSNLDATDLKGEPIHQTLMAKKMQRLDESTDFRPFKFRIQAFTMGFLEELARSGYPEDKIPMKKIRNYLWRQQYILRFNEDGKKAKSKGNHIWNIDAKKTSEGKWEFRPYHRKLAGVPSVAYRGLKWSWAPRVWDPQASWQNVRVEYSSPSLPSWLSWNDDVLTGIPPPDAESCLIVTNAKFVLDGQEGQLTHTFKLEVAPMNSIEAAAYSRSRRPSLANEPSRRASDPVIFQSMQRPKSRPLPARKSSPGIQDSRVIRVLTIAAQRVGVAAQTQTVSASPPKPSEIQELVKQRQVLEHSVDAYGKAISNAGDNNSPQQSRLLAVAAQNVVVQAAHTVIADRAAAIGGFPQQPSETVAIKSVTVTELTDATQGAIAAAVKQQGNDSTEVDIMVAATSILKERSASLDTSTSSTQQPRSLSTGMAPRIMPMGSVYPLSSVAEYA